MTRRQSKNHWSGGIAAHPAPKTFRVQKSAGKFLASIFWDQDGILLIDYLQKGRTTNAEYYLSPLVQLKDILNEIRQRKLTKLVLFLHDNAPAHRALATQKKLAYLGFFVLITHPIIWIWPRWTTTYSLNWKNNWKVVIFRPTWRSLLPPWPGWTDKLLTFFWVACKSYSNGLRSVLSFTGSTLNKSRVWSL